jgi:hypothetical protein
MMMKLLTKMTLAAAGLCALTALADPPKNDFPAAGREYIEWCDVWISHANETKLPRVLLLGDSITRAYYSEVEKQLEGQAYVARLATSRFISDPMLAKEIALVLDGTKFDVIHFNNGMHGWQHSEAEYRSAFPSLLAVIRKHAPKARLIWASTTTLKVSPAPGNGTEATDERIAARNAIALEFVKPLGIPVDDLSTLTSGHPEYHEDNVHFNGTGVGIQARQVAAMVENALKKRD